VPFSIYINIINNNNNNNNNNSNSIFNGSTSNSSEKIISHALSDAEKFVEVVDKNLIVLDHDNENNHSIFVIDDSLLQTTIENENQITLIDTDMATSPLQQLQQSIPSKYLVKEKAMGKYLDILYDSPLKFENRLVQVGGRQVFLNAFHYSAENLAAPTNIGKREYIDESEEVELYRWELKGALCTKLLKVSLFPIFYFILFCYFFMFNLL